MFEEARRNPNSAEAQRKLAIALHAANRRTEALERFKRSAELEPTRRHLLDSRVHIVSKRPFHTTLLASLSRSLRAHSES